MRRSYLWFIAALYLLSVTPMAYAVTVAPTLQSKKGMVTAAHPLAARAGAEILEKGGNAVDAAIAVSFALGVVEPYASGLGGEGYLLMDMVGKDMVAIDFRSTAPAKTTYEALKKAGMTIKQAKQTTKAYCVAGTPAGAAKAHELGATLPLDVLLAPAIRLAEEGFKVNRTFATLLADNYDKILQNSPQFLNDGFAWEEGEIFKNLPLAKTLRTIAKKGIIKAYYKGELADSFDAYMRKTGGWARKSDLKKYKTIVQKPIHGSYKGYDVYTAGNPVGGPRLLNSLNMLAHFDFGTMGADDPMALHIMQEIFVMGGTDQRRWVGDPAFSKDLPQNGLISKDYARSRLMMLDLSKASDPKTWGSQRTGDPCPYDKGQSYEDVLLGQKIAGLQTDTAKIGKLQDEGPSTTHFAVVDAKGNAVSWTQTISAFFGTTCMVDGYFLNNELGNFKGDPMEDDYQRINLEPGKRPRTNIAPVIVKKDGKVHWVLGSPGGSRIISTVAQIMVHMIDQGMTLEEAVKAPKMIGYDGYKELRLEDRFSPKTIEVLEKVFGHKVKAYAYPDLFFGGPNVIQVDVDGTLTGVGSIRRLGGSAAPQK